MQSPLVYTEKCETYDFLATLNNNDNSLTLVLKCLDNQKVIHKYVDVLSDENLNMEVKIRLFNVENIF